MNNKEKLQLSKYAGAAEGFWAGNIGTGAEKGLGATAGVTAGLGATPIPVLNTRNLRQHNNELSEMKSINEDLGSPAVSKGITNMEAKTEGLNAKVPDYMRNKHTGV
tara:strand:- start:224 stop:544 length:321 start_codon:yes stop_codon:yes gene_type:complete